MALSIRQATSGANGASSPGGTVVLGTPVQAGSAVAVFIIADLVISTITFSDGSGDLYTDSGHANTTDGAPLSTTFKYGCFLAPTVGESNFSVVFNVNSSFFEMVIVEVTGFVSTPTIDKTTMASGTGTAIDTGSSGVLAAPAQAALCYAIQNSGSPAVGSGWTGPTGSGITSGITAFAQIIETQLISGSTAPINGTATHTSGNWRAALLTLQDGGASVASAILMAQALL